MRLLIIAAITIISTHIYAAGTNDVYLTRAGWEQQSGGWVDPLTGLTWSPEMGSMSWGQAKSFCRSMKLGGRKTWRLPTVRELQFSVCKISGYKTRTPCPKPRDHNKDLWLLIIDKGTTYWAGNLRPGDPYNAYYFMFDVDGQYVMTSKGDKSKARCVTEGVLKGAAPAPKAVAAVPVAAIPAAAPAPAPAAATPAPVAEPAKPNRLYYFAAMIGMGGFFSREIGLDTYPFINGDARLGFMWSKDFALLLMVNTGANIKSFSDGPLLTTITFGPEYFLTSNTSIFGAIGGGILTTNRVLFSGQYPIRDTSGGFAWKLGVNWRLIRWGTDDQYNIPLMGTYTGTKTSMILCHTVVLMTGFQYFY